MGHVSTPLSENGGVDAGSASPGDQVADALVAQVQACPHERADVHREQQRGPQRRVDAQLRAEGAAQVAGEQDRADHGSTRNGVQRQADQLQDTDERHHVGSKPRFRAASTTGAMLRMWITPSNARKGVTRTVRTQPTRTAEVVLGDAPVLAAWAALVVVIGSSGKVWWSPVLTRCPTGTHRGIRNGAGPGLVTPCNAFFLLGRCPARLPAGWSAVRVGRDG